MVLCMTLLQDLPNYAQHTVPIFSLPQEWLWCESWCGNATKSRAKTIDLCNNPMTKEPKLRVRCLICRFSQQMKALRKLSSPICLSPPFSVFVCLSLIISPLFLSVSVFLSLSFLYFFNSLTPLFLCLFISISFP